MNTKNKDDDLNIYVTKTLSPWYLRRWYLRTRVIEYTQEEKENIKTFNSLIFPTQEFYIPWWAKPIDLIYSLFLKTNKIIPNKEEK